MTKLSPGRVADSFALLLARLGSPAPDPSLGESLPAGHQAENGNDKRIIPRLEKAVEDLEEKLTQPLDRVLPLVLSSISTINIGEILLIRNSSI